VAYCKGYAARRWLLMLRLGDAFVNINDEDTFYPDQDILNTWAFYNQQKYGELPCRWNRRVGRLVD
jgi:lipopolysaccharide biosynthesis glycosyltransferase